MTIVASTSVHSDINAILQPFVKPGSIPTIRCPFNGDVSNNCLRFVANTSMEAFSADFVKSFRIRRVINGCTKKKKFKFVYLLLLKINHYVSSKCIR